MTWVVERRCEDCGVIFEFRSKTGGGRLPDRCKTCAKEHQAEQRRRHARANGRRGQSKGGRLPKPRPPSSVPPPPEPNTPAANRARVSKGL